MAESLRAAQKALTRQRLIAAAVTCFEKEGYAATSIEDITRTAGATRATFYLHFASKSEIAAEVWHSAIDDPASAFWEGLAPMLRDFAGDPAVIREQWFPRVLAFWQLHGRLVHTLYEIRAGESAIAAGMAATRERVVSTVVDTLQSTSRHSRAALRVRATAAFEVQTQLYFAWLDGAVDADSDLIADALADAWTALLT